MTLTETCPCLHEEPQGIRPGPNAKTRMEADPKCRFCHGDGNLSISVAYEPPPIPTDINWQAVVDGIEEDGPVGYGPTKVAAVMDLMLRLEE